MANWMSAVKLEVLSSSLIREAVPVWHCTPIYFFVVFSVVLLQQVQISIKYGNILIVLFVVVFVSWLLLLLSLLLLLLLLLMLLLLLF